MTSDDLLSIGDFARAVGLPASVLRHYDECGLLVPALTDAATGYRYYTPALEQRARLLAMMRYVGMPIETMRAVLDGGRDDARAALDALGADREEQAARTRRLRAAGRRGRGREWVSRWWERSGSPSSPSPGRRSSARWACC